MITYKPNTNPGASYKPVINDEGNLIPGVVGRNKVMDFDTGVTGIELENNGADIIERQEMLTIADQTYIFDVIDVETEDPV